MWTTVQNAQRIDTELVTNGGFSGNANDWTLGTGWSYGTNNISYTPFGSELITNGSFTGGITGWTTVNAGGLTWAYGTNNITLTGTSSAGAGATLSQTGLSFTQGQKYRARLDMTLSSGTLAYSIALGSNTISPSSYYNSTGSYDNVFTLSGSPANGTFAFQQNNRGGTVNAVFDNFSLQETTGGTVTQDLNLTLGREYTVSVTVGGTAGSVTVDLGDDSFVISAGTTGTQTLTAGSTVLTLTPSDYFDGTIDDVSVLTTQFSWTNIPKPSAISSTVGYQYLGGTPIGLLLSLTQTSIIGVTSVVTSKWTDVAKAAPISWTNIPKP